MMSSLQPSRSVSYLGVLNTSNAILLVAPRAQSVTLSAGLVNLEDLDKVVAIIKEHNSKYKSKKVKGGACLVDRMILGKMLVDQG